jgi:hypothetical protein
VYRLRQRGVKLDRKVVLETKAEGYIRCDEARAYLMGNHEIQLGCLENVRLWRMLPNGAMLLHGTELLQTRRELRDVPQAWWCVPLGGK